MFICLPGANGLTLNSMVSSYSWPADCQAIWTMSLSCYWFLPLSLSLQNRLVVLEELAGASLYLWSVDRQAIQVMGGRTDPRLYPPSLLLSIRLIISYTTPLTHPAPSGWLASTQFKRLTPNPFLAAAFSSTGEIQPDKVIGHSSQ